MSKLRATRAQVIAAAIIVVLAVVLGGVGLYGMNARRFRKRRASAGKYAPASHSQYGGQRRGGRVCGRREVGSLDKARESGGGMSAVREAAAKAEEEARAKAEELGIGAVDLSEIDTQPMSAALDVLLAAQQAYFAEEAERAGGLCRAAGADLCGGRRHDCGCRRQTIRHPTTWRWKKRRSISPASSRRKR